MMRRIRRPMTLVVRWLVVVFFLIGLSTCDPQVPTPSSGDAPPSGETARTLDLGTKLADGRSYLLQYGTDNYGVALTEELLHEQLLSFAYGFNRVSSLVNSVLFADFEATDRSTLKTRVEAAIEEIDAFILACKGLETIGTALDGDLQSYRASSRFCSYIRWSAILNSSSRVVPSFG